MQSMNSVLMKFFNLPPAVRMVLALAGFGSLATIVFTLLPFLRNQSGRMWVLVIAGVGLLIYLIFWGVRRLFTGRKSTQLSGALASQGPTRGDVAEQEQIYREKFRSKLAELKTNGLSVYKLPWFVLMGEPGCGKTASLIHSGLDFPLGKDEVPGFGGTRNYNWWFTNEAVILDTAGRIAFHEEGTTDKTEWEYFLKLVRNNRARCPINGVVIALPVDKLLRDSSEERAHKAGILRERLRQVHQGLGVRFPTFVLVTKMDLCGGFSEFFEEVRVELAQRNQMFGWSRPGEFQEPYDTNTFLPAFDGCYTRIRDWAMRYLQRKATEEELGMIVTFPESFKALRTPLNDYVGTIFQKSPLLEPPFFRGFYFTSAVQEGAPILDVFSRSRAGLQLPERPTRAVDSKAFFIHDFYAKKVFPEQGLVFRSAKHVALNRRMRRMVWFGSAAMLVMMLMLFGVGWFGVKGLIENPRNDSQTAVDAAKVEAPKFADLQGNLATAGKLREHIARYDAPFTWLYARSLFIGANINEPKGFVQKIHSNFVLRSLLRPILEEAGLRLREKPITTKMPPEQRTRYLAALNIYTKWYGELVGQANQRGLEQEVSQRTTDIDGLMKFLEIPEVESKAAATEFEYALNSLAREPRSFSLQILKDTLKPDSARWTDNITAAIAALVNTWKDQTVISADSTNPYIQYWTRFLRLVGELQARYGDMLGLEPQFVDEDKYTPAVGRFLELTEDVSFLGRTDMKPKPGTIAEALLNLQTFLTNEPPPETSDHIIVRLTNLFDIFSAGWEKELRPLEESLSIGAPDRAAEPQRKVYVALTGGRDELRQNFELGINRMREQLKLGQDVEPLKFYAEQGLIVINEAQPGMAFRADRASIALAPGVLGENDRLRVVLVEMRNLLEGGQGDDSQLNDLRNWVKVVESFGASTPSGTTLAVWNAEIQKVVNAPVPVPRETAIREQSGLRDRPFWRPVDLYNTYTSLFGGRQRFSIETVLNRMTDKARSTLGAPELPGIARLMPGFDESDRNLPFERHRFNGPPPAERVVPPKPAEPPPATPAEAPPEEESGGRTRRTRPGGEQPAAPQPQTPASAPDGAPRVERAGRETERPEVRSLLVRYHTRGLLVETLRLSQSLKGMVGERAGADRLRAALDEAATAYVDGYLNEWFGVYSKPTAALDEKTLALLERCRSGELSWPQFVETLTKGDAKDVAGILSSRAKAFVANVPFFYWDLDPKNALDKTVEKLVFARIDDMKRRQAAFVDMINSMSAEQNAPGQSEGDPDAVFSGRILSAWSQYLSQLSALGPLSGDAPSSSSPPEVRQLASGIVYKDATKTDFRFIAPLLDVAGYGQNLLAHHLNEQLHQRLSKYMGRYPVGASGGAGGGALSPQEFVALLAELTKYSGTYRKLFASVQESSPALNTFNAVDAWVRFLYEGNVAGIERGVMPPAMAVQVAFVTLPNTTNAGAFYNKLTFSLPLLTQASVAAGNLEYDTRARSLPDAEAADQLEFKSYVWRLDSGPFEVSARASDKNERAKEAYPDPAVSNSARGDGWLLLQMIDAASRDAVGAGTYRLPFRISAAGETIGYAALVRMPREYPGMIPAPPAPGARPRMQ